MRRLPRVNFWGERALSTGAEAYLTPVTSDFVDIDTRPAHACDGHPGALSTASGDHPKFREPRLHT